MAKITVTSNEGILIEIFYTGEQWDCQLNSGVETWNLDNSVARQAFMIELRDAIKRAEVIDDEEPDSNRPNVTTYPSYTAPYFDPRKKEED